MLGSRRTGYPLWERLKPIVRRMRKKPTPAEALLWKALRGGRVGAKFRRQHPIGRWSVDFCCPAAMLAVEVDGDIHDLQREHDEVRSADLEMRGFRVVRFRNEQVTGDLDGVVQEIGRLLREQFARLEEQ